jgi:glucose-1-phosphate thymidylyltransferase
MKIKKAILTGGGRATRLRPITSTINKHLIPLANKPMIFHAIEKAVEAGVEEIFININPEETQLQQFVGDGGHWGVKITFFVQEGGPQGIAHVVNCAQKFIGKDPFMFYLSDNIVFGSLQPFFEQFDKENLDCLLAFAKVPDPERFGVPTIGPDGKLLDVIEKPQNPQSDFAVTGIYLFNHNFFEAFKNSTKSARGEYEIPSIFQYLLRNNFKVGYNEITGWWKDTGKPEDLILANELLLKGLEEEKFLRADVQVNGANIAGKVAIGTGTTFGKNVTINGPVMIGENCSLENCTIGPNVTIGSGSTIKNCTITDSIVLGNASLTAPLNMTQSIIGAKAIIESGKEKISRLIVGDHTVLEV